MAKSLVYKATADDAKEPTGFQLKELAQHSLTSLAASSDLATILLKRLEKDSADVKYKTLRCIKYLCLHGRSEFRMDVQRDSAVIKSAMQFRGPPDPLRGDAPYQRVRDEARDTLSAVFNGPAERPTSTHATGRIEGYGGGGVDNVTSPTSEQFGSSRPISSYDSGRSGSEHPNMHDPPFSTGKMVGFGNPQYDNSKGRSSPSFLDKVKAKINSVAEKDREPYRPSYGSQPTFQPPPMAAVDTTRKRGEVGGVWADDHSSGNFGGHSSAYAPQASPAASSAYTPSHAPSAPRPTSSNGEYESRLIDSLTPAAGVRTQPSKEELQKFATQCESLDKLLVVRLINESKLTADTHPTTQMKGLCLIECILTTGDARATEEVEDYLCENATNLEHLEKAGANLPLRNKAVRVMELCGLREEKRAPAPAPTSAPQPAPAAQHYQATAAAAAVSPQSNEVDLLGFASSPPAAPAASTSAFGFLESTSAAAAPAPSSSNGTGGDLFGSLEIKSTPAASPAAAAATSGSGDVFDLFTNQSSTQPTTNRTANSSPPPAAASSNNSLDFLNPSAPTLTTSSSSGKVDPLTLLMSTAKISTQPRAPTMPMMPQHSPQGAAMPFGANGMAGYPPRQNMPSLGPQYPVGYGQPQPGYPQGYAPGYPPASGYPQPGYGHPAAMPGYGQPSLGAAMPFGAPAATASSANANALFSVKAAGSSGASAAPMSIRPSIDLDPHGNPILLGAPTQPPVGSVGSGSSAFGFVANESDSFGFVNEMMKK